MGRADLIGSGKHQLIPAHQPAVDGYQSARRKNSTPVGSKKAGQGGKILTQHNGLPPRSHDGNAWDKREQAKAAAEARRKAANPPARAASRSVRSRRASGHRLERPSASAPARSERPGSLDPARCPVAASRRSAPGRG